MLIYQRVYIYICIVYTLTIVRTNHVPIGHNPWEYQCWQRVKLLTSWNFLNCESSTVFESQKNEFESYLLVLYDSTSDNMKILRRILNLIKLYGIVLYIYVCIYHYESRNIHTIISLQMDTHTHLKTGPLHVWILSQWLPVRNPRPRNSRSQRVLERSQRSAAVTLWLCQNSYGKWPIEISWIFPLIAWWCSIANC